MDPRADIPVELPPGRPALSESGEAVMWISDGTAPPGLWQRLRAAHATSGWWPLLLTSMSDEDGDRPWETGELVPSEEGAIADHDAETVLAEAWRGSTEVEEEYDHLVPAARLAVTAPHDIAWPGPAPETPLAGDPDEIADRNAEWLVERPNPRLGLVRAASGAEALSVIGWAGAVNHGIDVKAISAVLADWERRFGARLIMAGFDTLVLSTAAVVTDRERALRVAAEHFALCPDNVWQGAGSLEAYAESLLGDETWSFWWD
ncbi:DUF4253 domain-containing protein [Nocardiopsis lambiniae]|uniref:DUF4253 domain-containing protein n=1 Tax=Nocardiopsis lambiniae TaxID=3075539 RepID=A0ABU2MC82_9ACTN|nr:DUF4253 domain-containing protein [Nocardiopsis sp. DSM 44743]MDT0330293.1 DUF4253 domain-containing protein [Nocardiopsis sp. DSM 44743]